MPASLTTEDRVEILTKNSSYVANALTHAWVGQLFRTLWRHEPTTKLHVFHAEVDDAGTDVVLIFGSVTRHVQLKSAHHRSTTGEVPVNAALADSVGGCVVWVRYDVQSLAITGQSFAGAKPGEFWSELRAFSVARRTTRNGARERPLRPNVRKVPKKAFEPLPNYAVLAGRLFVEDTLNQVAVKRGPVVYCLESPDLPKDVRVMDVSVPANVDLQSRYDEQLLGGVAALDGTLLARPRASRSARFGFSATAQGHLRAWLLLAPAFGLRFVPTAEIALGILAAEA